MTGETANALSVQYQPTAASLSFAEPRWYDDDKMIELAQNTICRGSTKEEFALFLYQCKRTGLDPFVRQIYSIRRKQYNSQTRNYEEAQVTQISIDGFRLIAQRSAEYEGQVGPQWCGENGEWLDVWLSDTPPAAARVGVWRKGFREPVWGVCLYKSYVQTNSQGQAVSRWKTDPAGMLAKCAESAALRKAFPQELSGLYSTEEMSGVNKNGMTTQEVNEMKDELVTWAEDSYGYDGAKVAEILQGASLLPFDPAHVNECYTAVYDYWKKQEAETTVVVEESPAPSPEPAVMTVSSEPAKTEVAPQPAQAASDNEPIFDFEELS